MSKKNALILIDLQNDFCKGGSLAVSQGETIIPLANQLQPHFDLVIATQDWHPSDHMSFAINHPGHQVGDEIIINDMIQVLWPAHCIQQSTGAAFHPDLATQSIHHVFLKGTDKTIDSYSAFFDNGRLRATGLGDFLKNEQIEDVYLMGLATDYCVKYSALDAVHLGFNTYVIEDACRGVERQAGDSERALAEMRASGVSVIHLASITTR